MPRPPTTRQIVAIALAGFLGVGLGLLLLAPWGPSVADVRLELGGGLASGGVLAVAVLYLERRSGERDRRMADRQALQMLVMMERDLTGRHFSKADMTGIRLKNRRLTGSDLSFSIMTGCNLVGTALDETDLFHAVLNKIEGTGCSFEGADMRYVSLRQGQFMRRATFRNANLEGANLTDTPFVDVCFVGATVTGTDFTGSNLSMADMDSTKWDPEKPPKWPEGFDPPDNSWDADTDE
ncbi:MAG TPA: hypothetical protein DCQ04_12295 [Actinobacteria bacterium]|jgi:hypothetical protein|nr:hypothetical protein [Actinomycetota bacterium]